MFLPYYARVERGEITFMGLQNQDDLWWRKYVEWLGDARIIQIEREQTARESRQEEVWEGNRPQP